VACAALITGQNPAHRNAQSDVHDIIREPPSVGKARRAKSNPDAVRQSWEKIS